MLEPRSPPSRPSHGSRPVVSGCRRRRHRAPGAELRDEATRPARLVTLAAPAKSLFLQHGIAVTPLAHGHLPRLRMSAQAACGRHRSRCFGWAIADVQSTPCGRRMPHDPRAGKRSRFEELCHLRRLRMVGSTCQADCSPGLAQRLIFLPVGDDCCFGLPQCELE